MGSMWFSVIATNAPCEHVWWISPTHSQKHIYDDKKITVAIVTREQTFKHQNILMPIGLGIN